MIRFRHASSALALVAVCAAAAPALAQRAASAEEAADEKSRERSDRADEIIVTGERLTSSVIGSETSFSVLGERSIIDTPFSVSSFTENLIETTAAVNLSDLLIRDPSVTADINPAGYQDGITVRGFRIGRQAVLYDGLPGLAKGDGFVPLYNLDRVELFRGANAIVSGAAFGGVGGSINLTLKRPGPDPVTKLTIGYQAEGPLAEVDVSRRFGPNDQFGVRFNLGFLEANGPTEQFERKTQVYSLYLDWQATEKLYFATELLRNVDRTIGYRDQLFLADGVGIPRVPDLKRNYQQPWSYIDSSINQLFVKGRWDFAEGWNVTASAGWIDSDPEGGNIYLSALTTMIDDQGTLVSSPYQYGFGDGNETVEAIQTLLNGKFRTGSVEHRLTAGYARFEQSFTGSGGAFAGVITSNLFNPLYVDRPAIAPLDGFFEGSAAVQSFVGMYEASLFGDRISLLAGGRQIEILGNYGADYPGTDKFTPFGAVSFKPTANSSLYVSYAESLELGSQAPIGTANALEFLPPGAARQIEVGGKIDLDGLILTAAYFDIERPLEVVNAENRFVQDGRQVHKGVELQAQGRVGRNLNIITGVTWLDATIADNGDPAVAGNRPVGVPEWQATFFADYDVPVVPGLGVNAGVVYEARQFFDLTNERSVGGWARVDAGGRYAFKVGEQPLVARLAVTNVLNNGYWTIGNFPGLGLSGPRTVSVSLSAAF